MRLSLYDKNLNRIAYIGEQYISCFWSEGYNTVQNFTVELVATSEYRKKVRTDCYVGRGDRPALMVIKSVEISNGKIVASGKTASRIMDDVAFVGTIKAGQTIDTAIKNAYNKTVKYNKLSIDDGNVTAKYNHQISHKSILELCLNMCQSADVGFRTIKKAGYLVTEFYQPQLNPNLVFSEKFGNLFVENIVLSNEAEKNYAIVLGAGEGENRTKVYVDLTGGEDRKEIIVDADDIQKEEGETDSDYNSKLTARGIEKLLEMQGTFSCSFVPYAKDFGTRYDLGDVLTIYLSEYGITLQSRVASFSEKSQGNSTEITVQVGKITLMR